MNLSCRCYYRLHTLLLAQVTLADKIFTIQCIWSRSGRAAALHVQNFKFLKEMGLKKPGFLPDFGKVDSKSNRRVIITRRTWRYVSTMG